MWVKLYHFDPAATVTLSVKFYLLSNPYLLSRSILSMRTRVRDSVCMLLCLLPSVRSAAAPTTR